MKQFFTPERINWGQLINHVRGEIMIKIMIMMMKMIILVVVNGIVENIKAKFMMSPVFCHIVTPKSLLQSVL